MIPCTLRDISAYSSLSDFLPPIFQSHYFKLQAIWPKLCHSPQQQRSLSLAYFSSKQRGKQSALLTVRTDWNLFPSEMMGNWPQHCSCPHLSSAYHAKPSANQACLRQLFIWVRLWVQAGKRKKIVEEERYTFRCSSRKLKCTFNACLVISYATFLSLMSWATNHPGYMAAQVTCHLDGPWEGVSLY